MNMIGEAQKLASTVMTSDNFEYFMKIAQKISKNHSESQRNNVKEKEVKIPNGTQIINVYSEQYKAEQVFLIIFSHQYANMVNKMQTPAVIGSNVKTPNFLVPAYYDPETKKISYRLDTILREKSSNFANVLELCFHENRHAMQFKSFSINSPEELINFDPNSIAVLKDWLVMLNGNYNRNHINSLLEIDANLYARGLSNQLVTQYFSEHQDDLGHTDFASKEEVTDNPFDEFFEHGLILGEYALQNGEKADRAIMMDKNLKAMISPQLVAQFPMLKLIWKDGRFKTYAEIIEDKQALLQKLSSKQLTTLESPNYYFESLSAKERVERHYSTIIQSDPMLYLESLLSSQQIRYFKVKTLFTTHPILLSEYKAQITGIFSRKLAEIDSSQLNIFKRLLNELNIDLQSLNVSINAFTKNALNNGVRPATIQSASEHIPSVPISRHDAEEPVVPADSTIR